MTRFLLEAAAGVEGPSLITSMLPMLGIVAVFYLMFMRPQKKREKKVQEMRNTLGVGDEITTIGGIIGTVVVVKEEYLVIETGSDRSKMRIARWAVQSNNTASVGDSSSNEGAELK